jgi:hypothetical protein
MCAEMLDLSFEGERIRPSLLAIYVLMGVSVFMAFDIDVCNNLCLLF